MASNVLTGQGQGQQLQIYVDLVKLIHLKLTKLGNGATGNFGVEV